MNRKAYDSDLTDAELRLLAPFIPSPLLGGRPRNHSMREVLDAIFYISRGGVHGYDGGKKVGGRKRHILVDTTVLLLKARVHAANITDRDGARLLLGGVSSECRRGRKRLSCRPSSCCLVDGSLSARSHG